MRQARERVSGGREGGREGGRGGSQGVGRKIAVRTRYFDDFLMECGREGGREGGRSWLSVLFRPWRWVRGGREGGKGGGGGIEQVLILGSGMDTRAWRLPLPNTTIIEVDVAAVLQAKEQVLRLMEKQEKQQQQQQQQQQKQETSPPPFITQLTVKQRLTIPADFSSSTPSFLPPSLPPSWPTRVQLALPSPSQPLAIVLEGLLMYLSEEEVIEVVREAGRLARAKGSRVGFSLVDRQSVKDAQKSNSPLRRTWLWGCDEEEAAEFFAKTLSASEEEEGGREGGRAWKVTHVTRVGKKGGYPGGANYGCWKEGGKGRRKGKTLYVLAERVR